MKVNSGSRKTMLIVVWLGLSLGTEACQQAVQSGLDESEANEMLLVLAEAGLPAEKKGGGAGNWRVEVDGEKLSLAFQALSAAGLPRKRHQGFMGVYKERGLVPDRLEAQALFLSALQEELAATIEGVDGVLSARVHVSLPVDRPERARSGGQESRASVLISHQDDAPPLPADEVRSIVAHAVSGLRPEQVAVVFVARPQASLRRLSPELATEQGLSLSWLRVVLLALALGLALLAIGLWGRKRLVLLNGRGLSRQRLGR